MQWLISYKQQLSQQIINQKLPHALLFSGVKGVGKKILSDWLIQVLLCQKIQHDQQKILQPCQQCKHCLLHNNHSFPDHINIVSEKASIGVDDIRQTSAFLQKTAHMSGYKSVVIAKAETMTESAANALLKTLEEPSKHSLILLLSADIEQLLPTIISRCRVIELRPFVGDALMQQLNANSHDAFVNLTHLPELTDTSIQLKQQQFNELFWQFLSGQESRTPLLSQLLDDENALRWLEQTLVNMNRQLYNWNVEYTPVLAQLTQDRLYYCYQQYLSAKKCLVNLTQANKTFVIEKMLIDMRTHLIGK
jgi:DNA polymerase-3 subunit delta'